MWQKVTSEFQEKKFKLCGIQPEVWTPTKRCWFVCKNEILIGQFWTKRWGDDDQNEHSIASNNIKWHLIDQLQARTWKWNFWHYSDKVIGKLNLYFSIYEKSKKRATCEWIFKYHIAYLLLYVIHCAIFEGTVQQKIVPG